MNQSPIKTSQNNSTDDPHSGSSSIHDESSSSLNTSSSTGTDSSRHCIFPIIPTKNLQVCIALNYLDQSGAIKVMPMKKGFSISKIQKVIIEDNFGKLYDKGKNETGKYLKYKSTIPDMTFWNQRYYYYSKFDEGIQMDYESNTYLLNITIIGWYSVTPEAIAKYIANLTKDKTVIDGFCGSGGNVIQFSYACKKVYAIDIDKTKLDICKNNCKVYHCKNNIEYILSDYLKLKGKLKADYVFLSPPWGGVKYKNNETYDILKLMTPNIIDIVKVSLSIAKNIIFYLPRNLILEDLYNIISTIKNETDNDSGNKLCFDVRILKSNKKIKALMIIFGYQLSSIVNENDIHDYLLENYDNVTFEDIKIIRIICDIIGFGNFFILEYDHRTKNTLEVNIIKLIKMLWTSGLNEENKRKIMNEYLSYQSKIIAAVDNDNMKYN